jgi:Secretion system C-terminal sorting domain
MMYVPEKTIETPRAELIDSIKQIDIVKCSIKTIESLPEVVDTIFVVELIEPYLVENVDTVEVDTIVTDKGTEPIQMESSFDLFPNPSNDLVSIVSSDQKNFNLDIFDGNGKKIHAIINSNGRYTLDVSGYSGGVYYALITVDGKAVETKKIIVTR